MDLHVLDRLSQEWGRVNRFPDLPMQGGRCHLRACVPPRLPAAQQAPQSVQDYPGELPKMLRQAFTVAESAGLTLGQLAYELRVNVPRLASCSAPTTPCRAFVSSETAALTRGDRLSRLDCRSRARCVRRPPVPTCQKTIVNGQLRPGCSTSWAKDLALIRRGAWTRSLSGSSADRGFVAPRTVNNEYEAL